MVDIGSLVVKVELTNLAVDADTLDDELFLARVVLVTLDELLLLDVVGLLVSELDDSSTVELEEYVLQVVSVNT